MTWPKLVPMRVMVLAALLLAAPARTAADSPPTALAWTLVRAVDGVNAWAAEGPNEFWGFARGRVDAPAAAIIERITSFETLPKLNSRLDQVRVLERTADTALVYFHYHLPWPLSDRSYTVQHHWGREPSGALFLDVDDANALGPPPDGSVRVRGFLARILLTPARDGAATDVEYLFRADLAGYLPRAVRAQTAWKIPLNVILALRRSLESHVATR